MRANITTLIIAIAILTSSFLGITIQAQNVNIPDANFKAFLLTNATINTNGDQEISIAEAEAYTGELSITNVSSSESITDFTGLEAFINITKFDFAVYTMNPIEVFNLNLTNFPALQEVAIGGSVVADLDISNNPSLTIFHLSHSDITSVNLSKNAALNQVSCGNNSQLITLDVSDNPSLIELSCNNNKIKNLDVSASTQLTDLYCFNNDLTSLDVSNNSNLIDLFCSSNNLTSLDVSNNPALNRLSCSDNNLSSIDVSNNITLTELNCYSNQLTSLDISQNTNLVDLLCFDNALLTLNVANGNNENMYVMLAHDNPNLTCIQHDEGFNPATKPYDDGEYAHNIYDATGWKKDGIADWSTVPCNLILNIPDTVFKNILLAHGNTINNNAWVSGIATIDTNGDGEIQLAEAQSYTGHIWASSNSVVTDFTGLEAFKNMTEFSFSVYSFTPVEVANLKLDNFPALKKVTLFGDFITPNINASNNLSLVEFSLEHAYVKSLDLSNNPNLSIVECRSRDDEELEELKVNNSTALTRLICRGKLTDLDVSTNTALTYLSCAGSKLTSLDVSNNTNLTVLHCGGNELTNLDVSNNTALDVLTCSINQLTSLDVSNNTALTKLNCFENQLTSLDLSYNGNLVNLLCFDNPQMTTLNLANGNNENTVRMLMHNNPSLTCIQHDADFDPATKPHDDGEYASVYDDSGWKKDDTASWSTTPCSSIVNTEEIDAFNQTMVFPNPFKNVINISNTDNLKSISVCNIAGQVVKHFKPQETLDLSELNQSVYLIKLLRKDGNVEVIKAIKN